MRTVLGSRGIYDYVRYLVWSCKLRLGLGLEVFRENARRRRSVFLPREDWFWLFVEFRLLFRHSVPHVLRRLRIRRRWLEKLPVLAEFVYLTRESGSFGLRFCRWCRPFHD